MPTVLTRRSLLVSAAFAGTAAAFPVLRSVRERGYDGDRRRAYEALVQALVADGALPGGGGDAGDRLAALYRDALPGRRREIDSVLDKLARANLARKPVSERLSLLRAWSAAGGERRVVAARALALAGAAYGPADRPLTVVI